MTHKWCFAVAALTLLADVAALPQPSLQSGTVLEAAERLEPGEFLWAPEVAPSGPVILVVSLAKQRAVVYRNGLPIGITTVSTGRPGYSTPTGVFTILEKDVEHYSSLYDDAPMPYMQRLTWRGVALHGGTLPGYPASHGCIRLPHEFAEKLFGVTRIGMTVVITGRPTLPSLAPTAGLISATPTGFRGTATWHPERAAEGPVSIVVSAGDRRALVLRNGILIGSAPVEIQETISRTTAYVLRSVRASGQEWIRIPLPGQNPEDAAPILRGRIRVSDEFRQGLEPILKPGTTVVVTADSLQLPSSGQPLTLIEGDRP